MSANSSALVPLPTAAREITEAGNAITVDELRALRDGPDLEVHGAGDYVYRHSVEKLKVRRARVGGTAL